MNNLKNRPALAEKNLQIIACAGSGKTEFISHRIAYIISEKIAKPENIVAFTFTEKAAEELKFRIRSKIRDLIGHQPDIGDIYVGTIHSFGSVKKQGRSMHAQHERPVSCLTTFSGVSEKPRADNPRGQAPRA